MNTHHNSIITPIVIPVKQATGTIFISSLPETSSDCIRFISRNGIMIDVTLPVVSHLQFKNPRFTFLQFLTAWIFKLIETSEEPFSQILIVFSTIGIANHLIPVELLIMNQLLIWCQVSMIAVRNGSNEQHTKHCSQHL